VVTRGNLIHDYYQMPFVPVAAYFVARGLFRSWHWIQRFSLSPRARSVLGVAFVCASMLAMGLQSFAEIVGFYVPNEKLLRAARAVRAMTQPGDRIVSVEAGAHQPEMFYFSHRRGWHLFPNSSVEQLRVALRNGARTVVFLLDGSPEQNESLLRSPLMAYTRRRLGLAAHAKSHLIFHPNPKR